jgi:hypothetical protein
MSRRRPPPLDDDDDELDVLPDDELDDPLEEVEYFVDVDEESSVLTSVPKSVHSSQTSSSAPSIFTRLGDETSLPHISH